MKSSNLIRSVATEGAFFGVSFFGLYYFYLNASSEPWVSSWLRAIPVLQGLPRVESAWTLSGMEIPTLNLGGDVITTVLSLSLGTPSVALALPGAFALLILFRTCSQLQYSIRAQGTALVIALWGCVLRMEHPQDVWNALFSALAVYALSLPSVSCAIFMLITAIVWALASSGAWVVIPGLFCGLLVSVLQKRNIILNLCALLGGLVSLLAIRGAGQLTLVTPDFHQLPHLAILYALMLAAGLSGYLKTSSMLLSFLLATALLSLIDVRFIAPFVLTSAVALGSAAQPRLSKQARLLKQTDAPTQGTSPMYRGLVASTSYALFCALTLGFAASFPLAAPVMFRPQLHPLFSSLRGYFPDMTKARIFHEAELGDILAWYHISPFIDPRSELYSSIARVDAPSRSVQKDYETLQFVQPGWEDVLSRWNIDAVIADRESSLASVLITKMKWQPVSESVEWNRETIRGPEPVHTLVLVRGSNVGE